MGGMGYQGNGRVWEWSGEEGTTSVLCSWDDEELRTGGVRREGEAWMGHSTAFEIRTRENASPAKRRG